MVATADRLVSQVITSGRKHKNNHYSLQDFFHPNHEQGILSDWNGLRNVLTTEDFIIGLQEGLEEEVGSASAAVMYTIGNEWGKRDGEFFTQWFEKDFGSNVRQTNLPFLLETWWWPFTAQGWGRWSIDMSDRKQGFMFISIYDSAVARTLGDVGKPVCHLYAGLFSGFFTYLVNKKLDCIEIQCYSMGENYCKFLLGGNNRIDAAAFWLNEGATSRDIERRLHGGEMLK
ncbi:MAG: V4R domain-containing protein [Pseudanabaenaceae cyanobacterium bins.68]|nr:V4R domain-containing protein [Pseudanabaenaceae cyanobacterium bins.68]